MTVWFGSNGYDDTTSEDETAKRTFSPRCYGQGSILGLRFSMFIFCFKPLVSTAMIASLLVAQFVHVPHVHVDSSSDQRTEHSSRPHVHLDGKGKGKHGHSHAHGHSHSHSHKSLTKSKSKTRTRPLAYSVDHDQDAVYMVPSEMNLPTRSTFEFDSDQRTDVQFVAASLEHTANRSAFAFEILHQPDRFRHCPIYLLTMSIRC